MMHARTKRRYAREEAGFAIRYSAPRQKHLTAALGVTQSNVSRQIRGEQDGDVSRFYDVVRRAVLDGRADAGHLIGGALAVAEEAACTLPRAEILGRLADALSQETAFQAAGVRPTANLVFFFEGEEEAGSANLGDIQLGDPRPSGLGQGFVERDQRLGPEHRGADAQVQLLDRGLRSLKKLLQGHVGRSVP